MGGSGNQQFLSNVLSTHALPYAEESKWFIRQHLMVLSDAFPSLQIKTSNFTHNNGRDVTLLQAQGTIPMVFQGNTYNIPILIWLMETYPRHPPLVYVTPTSDMIIKRDHSFVRPDGLVSIPYLQNWVYPGSNLLELARNLSAFFGTEPPVYSQRRPTPPNHHHSPSEKPAIPPRMNPPYPPSPYTANSASAGGRIMDDPAEVYKKNAINQLVLTAHTDMMGLKKAREADVDGLIRTQSGLRHHQNQLATGLKEMQDEKEALEQQLQMVLMNVDVMEEWLRENEEKLANLTTVKPDEAFELSDALSKQLMDCSASDSAIDDVIDALDTAVQAGAIPFDQYLRNVRLLARDQFFHRATSSKVRAAQMHAQVSRMASRVQYSA